MPLFNVSNTDSNADKLFEAIGTFYENIPEPAKVQLKAYFEALARLKSGTHFNLYQSDLMQYLKFSEGWLELLYKNYRVYFDNTGTSNFKNTKNEYLDIPQNISASGGGTGNEVYAYRIAAYNTEGETIASEEISITGKSADLSTNNVTVSWDAVANATGYKVYGRDVLDHQLLKTVVSTTYADDGTVESTSEQPKEVNTALHSYLFTLPEDHIYLSIPELIENGSSTLTEDVDYEIVSTNKIRFFNSSIVKRTDTVRQATYNEYLAKTGLILSPVLTEFYLKAFGKDNPKEIILNGKYFPHIDGYNSLNKFEQAQARAKHLKFFCWASSVFLRRKPTIASIEQAYGLAQDYPFSYEDGEVTDITGQVITVSGQSSYSYDIGTGNSHLFNVSDDVKQFDLLAAGISLKDYYSHPTTISGLATQYEEPRLVVQLTSTATGFNADNDVVSKFKKVSIPAGLVVKS